MGNADQGAKFFTDGVNNLKSVPENARSLVFQICTRQLVLSSSIALETFELIPRLAKEIKDDELFTDILSLASEIANRSAKHSADFLNKTPQVAKALKRFDKDKVKRLERKRLACLSAKREQKVRINQNLTKTKRPLARCRACKRAACVPGFQNPSSRSPRISPIERAE